VEWLNVQTGHQKQFEGLSSNVVVHPFVVEDRRKNFRFVKRHELLLVLNVPVEASLCEEVEHFAEALVLDDEHLVLGTQLGVLVLLKGFIVTFNNLLVLLAYFDQRDPSLGR
jgi:hypothetical protein